MMDQHASQESFFKVEVGPTLEEKFMEADGSC